MASKEITKTTVILETQADWPDWIKGIKHIAVGRKAWEYINPDLKAYGEEGGGGEGEMVNQLPKEPEPVDPNTFSIDLQNHATFTSERMNQFNFANGNYTQRKKAYDKLQDAFSQLEGIIMELVATLHFSATSNAEPKDLHKKLVRLKKEVGYTPRAYARALRESFHRLQKGPVTRDACSWLGSGWKS